MIGKRYKEEKKEEGRPKISQKLGNCCLDTVDKSADMQIAIQSNVSPRTVKNAEKFFDNKHDVINKIQDESGVVTVTTPKKTEQKIAEQTAIKQALRNIAENAGNTCLPSRQNKEETADKIAEQSKGDKKETDNTNWMRHTDAPTRTSKHIAEQSKVSHQTVI